MSHSSTYKSKILSFLSEESGPTAVEYAVMLSLVAITCIGATISLGNAASGAFSDTSDKLISATSETSNSSAKGGKDYGGSIPGSSSQRATPSSGGKFTVFGGGKSFQSPGGKGKK